MGIRIINADVFDGLAQLSDESVHCVTTSPPYWRQRDYGIAGQIGQEKTPEEFIDKLVSVFREVRRVLRKDGTCWVNIGDKWASGGNGGGGSFMEGRADGAWEHAKSAKGWRKPPAGYKDKDLVGIPWMLAFAMRKDGWYLRQCNVWAKPNCMPESVRDRTTISHEYVFHFTKNNDYFYDAESVKTQALHKDERDSLIAATRQSNAKRSDKQRGHSRRHNGFNDRWDAMSVKEQQAMGANLRSVWWIAPANYPEGHFAVMPDELAEICIKAGSPKDGVVLDPFAGAGTTLLVADRLGRTGIGIELNPSYVGMAKRRVTDDCPLFTEVS